MFNITSKYFSISAISQLQGGSHIQQEVFLHVIPVRIIVPCYNLCVVFQIN